MPRSTLRRAACAGALCLTTTTSASAMTTDGHTTAHATKVGVSAKRLNVRIGSRVAVRGRVRAPGRVTASLQVRRGSHWATLDRDRTDAFGRYVLRDRMRQTMSTRARVRISTGRTRSLGRVNVYRYANASWYGPGLFGNPLACGGTLTAGRLGVAHKSLPCGSEVTIRHRGRVLRVPVIDRGPYVGGREFDLTAATAQKLGFYGYGPIQVAN
jgi:rare lipoprotein A (peptidoglycan hydrolase)